MNMNDSFGGRAKLTVGGRSFEIFRLDALTRNGIDITRLPYSLRILLEDLLRTEDGVTVTRDDIVALAGWSPANAPLREIAFTPAGGAGGGSLGPGRCVRDLPRLPDQRGPRLPAQPRALPVSPLGPASLR